MLWVDKINKLEYMNTKMADTLISIRDILIDGYNEDLMYTAFDDAISLIDKLDHHLEKYYKELKEV